MQGPGRASGSVMAAGIGAIIGGLLVTAGGAFAALGFYIAPPAPNGVELPPLAKTLAECFTVFVLLLGVFGMVTGVNLLRLKNWARISTLIWSGLTVFFCAICLIFTAIIPIPAPANVPDSIQGAMKAGVLMFYGLPLAIGLWWLVLFTRKNVVAQFHETLPTTMDESGFPIQSAAPAASCPLPLIVVGGFLVLAAFSVVFLFFMPVPTMVFGQPVLGTPGTVFFIAWSLACGAVGVGLLRLRPWGFWLTLGLQAFGLLSGIATLSSPNYPIAMREVVAQAQARMGGSAMSPSPQNVQLYANVGAWAALMAPVVIGAILLFYRREFFAAAAKRTAAKGDVS